MAETEKRTFAFYMRTLHRDVGFLMVGLILVYSISGIVLVYRDQDILKREVRIERKLAPNTDTSKLGEILHIRDFKVTKTEGDVVHFQNGTYDKGTGLLAYTSKEVAFPLDKFINLHKMMSKNPTHWFTLLFALSLSFLAISSFWMFKSGSRFFRRGIYFAGAGFLVTIILLCV